MPAAARRAAIRACRWWLLLWLGSGCNQILGVEEAHVDPTLAEQMPAGGSAGALADASAMDGPAAGGSSSSGGSSSQATTAAAGGTAGASDDTEATSGSSDTSAAAGGSTGSPLPSLCDDYCDDMMEVCTGSLLQYRDRAQCMTICSLLPGGTLGQVNENSIGCRIKFAGDARYGSGTELSAYCRQAGPGGDGRCGGNCDGFCSMMMQVCTPETAGLYHFESEADCLQTCRALPSGAAGYSVSDPLIADGNHVECRLFHVMSAAMLDAEEHCEHAMGITLCEAPSSE